MRQEDQSSGARFFDAVMHRDIGNLIGVDRARPAQLFADEIPAQEASSIQAPPKSMAEYREDGLEFEVAGEEHTVWIQPMGDEVVVMVASDPVPVTKQLLDWQKRLASIQDATKRQNTKDLISKCFDRIKILGEIGAEDNEDRQASAVSNHRRKSCGHLVKSFRSILGQLRCTGGSTLIWIGSRSAAGRLERRLVEHLRKSGQRERLAVRPGRLQKHLQGPHLYPECIWRLPMTW